MSKPLALIIAGSHDPEEVAILEKSGLQVEILPDVLDDAAREKITRARVLDFGMKPLGADMLDNAHDLWIIARHGAGYDNIDLEAASRNGIWVTNTPGANSVAVAEFTFGALLAVTRHILGSVKMIRDGGWRNPSLWGPELHGRTLGIVGLGAIGLKVAGIARGFGLRALGYDPMTPEDVSAKSGVERLELDELFRQADFVSLHCPLTPESSGLVNKRRLDLMQRGSFIVNMARGEIIVNDDLIAALDSGQLAGAALDAFVEEPPEDKRLITHKNILPTAHIGGWGFDAGRNICVWAAEQAALVMAGKAPHFAVNKPLNPRNMATAR